MVCYQETINRVFDQCFDLPKHISKTENHDTKSTIAFFDNKYLQTPVVQC